MSAIPFKNTRALATGSLLVALMSCGGGSGSGGDGGEGERSKAETTAAADISTVRSVVASEELILQLNPRIKPLAESFLSDGFVSDQSGAVLGEGFLMAGNLDLTSRTNETVLPGSKVKSFSVPVTGQTSGSTRGETTALWRGMVAKNAGVRTAEFHLISGTFNNDGNSFVTPCGFSALVKTGETWQSLTAEQKLTWTRDDDGEWKISKWRQERFDGIETPALLFEDVLKTAIPNEQDRQRAITSRHQQILVENYFGGKPARTPRGYSDKRFFPDSVNIHPALSVVDIDNDGWDDLYVCVRWGRNMLFHNLHDGTFEEVAAHYGLNIEGRSTSATFADFDNDGDPDLMLGRSLERSQYLINAGGNFIEASFGNVDGDLPFLVTSTSAADYNGDGLLDIFFCTYSPLDITARITGKSSATPEWVDQFLTAEEASQVKRQYAKYHGFLGQVGPPNALFVNKGAGKFARAPESSLLEGYRNTFQATWGDFDKDGDPDLYVANDFAPDNLFRNDGDAGFVDITESSGTNLMGFGMGAAFGDYNNDGWQDLYVSNMYSKAGRRITAQVPGIDQRMVSGSEGNYLFRNNGDATFHRVSGLEKPALRVANAGWSWGGQFADFDNDGYLDLYVSSGFYSPPEGLSNGVDL